MRAWFAFFCSTILLCISGLKTISTNSFRKPSIRRPGCCQPSIPTQNVQKPLLVRALDGEWVNRPPVWLLRQAGRYMSAFRKFSDAIPFRKRSETPSIAVELSLQPWKAFKTDAVIMFSDILTILPAMGIEFDMVKGVGPKILNPIRSQSAIDAIRTVSHPEEQLAFTGEVLRTLRGEVDSQTAVIGFVGAPFTLAAYAVEGAQNKRIAEVKKMMYQAPEMLHGLLARFTESICHYAAYQILSGADVLQIFDSWAHHLNAIEFEEFGKPYVHVIIHFLRTHFPDVPVTYYANGGSAYLPSLQTLTDIDNDSSASTQADGSTGTGTGSGTGSGTGTSSSASVNADSYTFTATNSEWKCCSRESSLVLPNQCCSTTNTCSGGGGGVSGGISGGGVSAREGDTISTRGRLGASLLIDYRCRMQHARAVLGNEAVLVGNVDPQLLAYGSHSDIAAAVRDCVVEGAVVALRDVGPSTDAATSITTTAAAADTTKSSSGSGSSRGCGGSSNGGTNPVAAVKAGARFVVNVGHGVEQDTPESNVLAMVEAVKQLSF